MASTTKRARQLCCAPSSSSTCTVAPSASNSTRAPGSPSNARAPFFAALRNSSLVEFGTAHLPCVRHRLVPGVAELEKLWWSCSGETNSTPHLCHAEGFDLLAHAELIEEANIGGQQRLADVKARVMESFRSATTSRLRWASSAAIVEPAGPPPTTSTSQRNGVEESVGAGVCMVRLSIGHSRAGSMRRRRVLAPSVQAQRAAAWNRAIVSSGASPPASPALIRRDMPPSPSGR